MIPFKRFFLNTFVGWLIGFLLVVVLALTLDGIGIEGVNFFIGISMGASIGFAQNRVLKKRLNIKYSWFWATLIGMSIVFTLFEFFAVNLLIIISIGGLLVGIIQSRIIRNHTEKYNLWIVFSTISWSLAGLCVIINDVVPKNPIFALVGIVTLIFGGGIALGLSSAYGIKIIMNRTDSPQ